MWRYIDQHSEFSAIEVFETWTRIHPRSTPLRSWLIPPLGFVLSPRGIEIVPELTGFERIVTVRLEAALRDGGLRSLMWSGNADTCGPSPKGDITEQTTLARSTDRRTSNQRLRPPVSSLRRSFVASVHAAVTSSGDLPVGVLQGTDPSAERLRPRDQPVVELTIPRKIPCVKEPGMPEHRDDGIALTCLR